MHIYNVKSFLHLFTFTYLHSHSDTRFIKHFHSGKYVRKVGVRITEVQLKKCVVFALPGYDGEQIIFFSVPWELLSSEA